MKVKEQIEGGEKKDWLNTKNFTPAANAIAKFIDEYTEKKRDLDGYFKALKEGWEGEGRKQFDINYEKLMRQLSDIQDELYDIRDSIINAEATYIKADHSLAKSFKQ